MDTLLRLLVVASVFLAACSNPAQQQPYAEQRKASEARVDRYLRGAEQRRLEWEAESRQLDAELQRLEEAVELAQAEEESRRRRFYENLPALTTQSQQIMCNWMLDAQASAIRLDDDRSDAHTITRLAVDGSRFGETLTRLWLRECYSYDMAMGYIEETKKSILDYTTRFLLIARQEPIEAVVVHLKDWASVCSSFNTEIDAESLDELAQQLDALIESH